MAKIKLFSHYHHFPNHEPQEGDKYICCYNDIFTMKRKEILDTDIALLIEPRFIQPEVYTYVEQNYKSFKYIFTHDSYLLCNTPNAKPIVWGGVWASSDMPKYKGISMVASAKANNYWRSERVRLAKYLKDKENGYDVDVYGNFNGGPKADTLTIYGPYKFNICMENCIDDMWMTEKLMNCFANKTIPIYIGAPLAKFIFNSDGIILAKDVDDILHIIRELDIDKEYEKRKYAVNENYEHVKAYANFENYFFDMYGYLLEDMI